MINNIKHLLIHGVTVITVVIGGNVYADDWMDCVPYRVAARSNGAMHIGCSNVPGWYYVNPTSTIMAGKTLKILVPKPRQDGEISAIELFK